VDQSRLFELELRIQHRHHDGGWGDMVEARPHGDAIANDPEREWGHHRIFRCASCPEEITLADKPGGLIAPR
jgi:hypothetical protein